MVSSRMLLFLHLLFSSMSSSSSREDIESFMRICNIHEVPLSHEVLTRASLTRSKYDLSYFDSLHAASALLHNGVIIPIDKGYRKVVGLRALDPRELV
ncbi:MAG: hypothetical protein DRN15_07760 [Thermoprotei archaeon]|nr:MAG: hypothetical protein DRN15_07760 [Thermoprotei archaeon]